tara:strand:- start:665 stop:952 length:288 start_codon:yes stop_codon:yes gene_type:complete
MGMARRLNPKHDAHTREKIQTSQLVNRLNSFVLSGVDPKTKKPIEMSREQITVALGLLKKTLPDLSSVELSGDEANPVNLSFNVKYADDNTPESV